MFVRHGTGDSQRGLALLTVLMIVVILLILIGALLSFMPVELNQAAYTGYDNRSLYAADAGIEYATEMIESEADSGIEPTPGPTPGGVPFVQFYLEPSPSPSASPDAQVYIQAVGPDTGPQQYYLTSIGYFDGIPHRVDAIVAQKPLNSNLLLGKSNAPGNYFVSGLMYFDGPVYLEGTNNPVNIQWYDDVTPVFGSTAQLAGNYKFYGPGGAPGAPGPNQWTDVDQLGKGGLTFSPNGAVQYPTLTDSASVANEAFTGTQTGTTFPTTPNGNGLYLDQSLGYNAPQGRPPSCNGHPEVDSGIYVQGDTDISMSSSSTGETFTFAPSGGPGISFSNYSVTVQIIFSSNQTIVTEDAPPNNPSETFCGVPSGEPQGTDSANGVIFVDGDVNALSGTVHGDYTIAVPDDATSGPGADSVLLTGDIGYQNDPDPANADFCNCLSTDMLGIYAHDVEVSQTSIPGAAQFEAAIFAGNNADVLANGGNGDGEGSYMVQGGFTAGARGTLNVFGSVVQNYVQPLGVFNQNTGKLVKDWADTYNWDKRLLTNVPPGMPESDSYAPIAWEDIGTP